MAHKRLVGVPPAFMMVSGLSVLIATAALIVSQGAASTALAIALTLLVWRLLGTSVYLEGRNLVVRNLLRTYQFDVNEVDVRARVFDPLLDSSLAYSEDWPVSSHGTPRLTKWYALEHGDEHHYIDALMGRLPSNHERVAWELRQQILAARDGAYGT